MRLLSAIPAAAVALAGCATATVQHWSKSGTDQQTFMQDRYVCLQEAQQGQAAGDNTGYSAGVVTNHPLFRSCMAARGYQADQNGNLFPPRDAVVH